MIDSEEKSLSSVSNINLVGELQSRKGIGGAPRKVNSPDELWERACDYFKWNEENPLIEYKSMSYQGVTKIEKLPVMRAMSIRALCTNIGIGRQTWYDLKKNEEFSYIIEAIENIIFNQQYEGAAAGLLKENIVARSLGLSDKAEQTTIESNTDEQKALQRARIKFSKKEVERLWHLHYGDKMDTIEAVKLIESEREGKVISQDKD